jgi:hypothetical protein
MATVMSGPDASEFALDLWVVPPVFGIFEYLQVAHIKSRKGSANKANMRHPMKQIGMGTSP